VCGRIGQVSEGDLHSDPLGAQTAGVAHQAAHGLLAFDETPEERPTHSTRGTGEEDQERAGVAVARRSPRSSSVREVAATRRV